MPKYEGSINGQKVEIRVDFTIASKLNGLTPKHKVKEREISIDDITLTPLSSANIGLLEEIMTLPGNPGMGAKLQIWPQRGDREEAASCLMATKGGKPLGYFNIGSSAIKMTYQDKEISPNESGGFNGSLSPQDYAKVVYAATSYYNLVFTANPGVFQSEYVIYTTKDPVMAEALKAAGWTAPQDDFLKAVTSIEPELKDGRPARFALQEGLFAERCRVTDESPQRWHYGYETKEIFIHHFGETNIAPLVGDDSAGASATP